MDIREQRRIGRNPKQKAPKPKGPVPQDPSPEEIERMKRLIREEKGDVDPIPEREVDWNVVRHMLNLDAGEYE